MLADWTAGAGKRVVVIATGSEVALAMAAREALAAEGIACAWCRCPAPARSTGRTPRSARRVLPPGVPRVAVEAGVDRRLAQVRRRERRSARRGRRHRHLRRVGAGRCAIQALRHHVRCRSVGRPALCGASPPRPEAGIPVRFHDSFESGEKHDDQGGHQRIRPHRPHGVARGGARLSGHRGGRHQRPARARLPRLHAAVRLRARPLQGHDRGRRQHAGRQRQEDPPDRREGSRRAQVGRRRRRRRHRVDRPLPDQGNRREAPRRRRQEGDHVGAVQGRHADVRLRRQRQTLRRPGDHLQRLVHDQLPRAGRQGAERQRGASSAA